MGIQPLRILGLAIKYLLICAVVLYAADWSVFEIRMARNTGMESIQVEQYLKTPLKGNKTEYDYMGMAEMSCSRSLFPQYAASDWNLPCWWLKGHRSRWQ